MAKIIYTQGSSGDKIGRWSGKSYRDEEGKPQKTGQIYLGKVVDEERLIFFKKEAGYYVFNPDDQNMRTVTIEDTMPGPIPRSSRAIPARGFRRCARNTVSLLSLRQEISPLKTSLLNTMSA